MLAEAAGLQEIRVKRVRGARFVLTARPGTCGSASLPRPMARVEGLTFAFGARTVLKDVSFFARSGQVVRITGANGSGKSTLLACVAGALRIRVGRVWLDRSHAAPGYVPQEGGLFSALSVGANIELAADLSKLPRAEREESVRRAAERLGLELIVGRLVHQLSGGMRRRVAVACSIVHRPNVLVLDEPDAGLDADGQAAIGRIIQETCDDAGVALFASHSPEWAPSMVGPRTVVEVTL